MKSTRLMLGLLVCLVTHACQKSEKTTRETPFQTVTIDQKADEIIRDTVTNKNGVQLAMAFNNTNQTAMFVLQGETIELKQERMASGIKYSNANYEFTEHQGEMTLKKDGNVIFSHKK